MSFEDDAVVKEGVSEGIGGGYLFGLGGRDRGNDTGGRFADTIN